LHETDYDYYTVMWSIKENTLCLKKPDRYD